MDVVTDLFENLNSKTVIVLVSVFSAGLISGFGYSELGSDKIKSTEFSVEANSSESIQTVSFFNRSIDVFVEDGANSTFYLDKNRDGSADETLEITRDGDIHQAVQFIDYRNNIYRLYYRYSDDPETEDEGWIEFYKAEELK
mgnify:CR=1 FL=1